jgi:hypothetical protein
LCGESGFADQKAFNAFEDHLIALLHERDADELIYRSIKDGNQRAVAFQIIWDEPCVLLFACYLTLYF